MIDTFIKQTSNMILASMVGYGLHLGITIEAATELVQNPMAQDWKSIAHAAFDTMDVISADIAPYVEGPVRDFAIGVREAVVERVTDPNSQGSQFIESRFQTASFR